LLAVADNILGGAFKKRALEEAEAEYEEHLTKEAAKKGQDRSALRAQDFQLWQQWKRGGQKPNDLRPLLSNFRGMIRGKANFWASRADMPPEAVHSEFTRQFVSALKTYNPDKGSALGTWVTNRLKKAQRWVTEHQDPTRTQETRYYQMGRWDNAFATLSDQFNREPTTREMAEHLGWSEPEAGRMEKEKRKALYSSRFEGYDPTNIMPSAAGERLKLARYELHDPTELAVYDHTIGAFGKEQLRPNQIAKKLRISPSKVTRIRQKIAGILEEYE
jgi:hypothetical protein